MMLNSNNKLIGGEPEIADNGQFYGITNSGRSSLRWAIESMRLQGKRILVPDFLCQIVIDVLLEYKVQLSFYTIQDDFEFCLLNKTENIDAVYLVKYFGCESESFLKCISSSKKPLIIDDVFGVELNKIKTDIHWCYFNSLRKITPVSDYSNLISNYPLTDVNKKRLVSFSSLKYKAKANKFNFTQRSIGNESDYLNDFSNAESILDNNIGIFTPEDKSIFLARDFYQGIEKERRVRLDNLNIAKEKLHKSSFIDIKTNFPTFLPILLSERDKIRSQLMSYSMFLAVHWPRVAGSSNTLPDRILSLPLDSRYTKKDIEKICEVINALNG
ncbi:pyridoxal phosphate-dependent transferase [Aliivibrio fischeri]|uniref:pyridoxal phosphate-dependent transferase n=1 Tax=Aliivibrio fischeri TaxID=668 RepID=UPI00080E1EB1|nr:pyridoxal phosphate-dependent transferase [Aliivibrio fischeri]OCH04118.1 pyridoxal phosphate-dependent transferase [Aliivibrio fischeri]